MWHPVLLIALLIRSASADVKQVAIIGGGVGGASSAYYLRSLLRDEVNITIIERQDALGGRTSSWEGEGQVFELGASIGWTGNRYLRSLAGEAGLSLVEHGPSSDDGLLAVFDGSRLVFRESRWSLLSLLRLLWRYGFSYFQIRWPPKEMSLRFSAVYPIQDSGAAFERPEVLLRALGLYDLTQQNMLEYIRNQFGYTTSMELFASEVVAGIGRVNYNQNNLQLNALAGLVSLLPAADPSVFSVQDGNQQLAPALAAKAGAALVRSVAVRDVAMRPDGAFDLIPESCGSGRWDSHGQQQGREGDHHQQEGGEQDLIGPQLPREQGDGFTARMLLSHQNQQLSGHLVEGQHPEGLPEGCQRGGGPRLDAEKYGPFDAVIIAAPLEGSALNISGVELPRLPSRKYQTTVTTLVKGALRPQYFGMDTMPYTEIMVTEDAQTPFSSLSVVGHHGDAGRIRIYKLFSQRDLQQADLAEIFEEGFVVLVSKAWKAYPRFDPPEDFAPFKLAEGLYYSNALENAASAMEIAAVAGRNSALLAAKHLLQPR